MATGIRGSLVSKHITLLQNVYTQLMEVVLWQHMYHCYIDMLHHYCTKYCINDCYIHSCMPTPHLCQNAVMKWSKAWPRQSTLYTSLQTCVVADIIVGSFVCFQVFKRLLAIYNPLLCPPLEPPYKGSGTYSIIPLETLILNPANTG